MKIEYEVKIECQWAERYGHYIVLSTEGRALTNWLYDKKHRRKLTTAKQIKLIIKDVYNPCNKLPF
jgi:hypothetical protein